MKFLRTRKTAYPAEHNPKMLTILRIGLTSAINNINALDAEITAKIPTKISRSLFAKFPLGFALRSERQIGPPKSPKKRSRTTREARDFISLVYRGSINLRAIWEVWQCGESNLRLDHFIYRTHRDEIGFSLRRLPKAGAIRIAL